MIVHTIRNASVLACLLFSACSFATEPTQPEQGFSTGQQALVTARDFMIVTANPIASKAGYEILEAGGTAMDAAIAAQLVLNLVEPQSSGIGGGAFLVYYDSGAKALTTLDGRETAPASIRPDHFIGEDGKPLPWWQRVVGGQSVGVPGTLKLLEEGHQRFGKSDWAELLQPAIRLARQGFTVSPRMAASIARAKDRGLAKFENTRKYFFTDDGEPLPAGYQLTNPLFAETLESIARQGARAFYHGTIGEAIVAAVNQSAPGFMSQEDLRNYQVVERPPVCVRYRQYQVCGMGPPSSGALSVGQTLGVLNHVALGNRGFEASAIQLISDAQKLAYADRALYIGDSDFVSVPVSGMLDPDYLAGRADLITRGSAMPKAEAGSPPGLEAGRSAHSGKELPGTSHLSIVDQYGNVLSMTTTIETGFGSRVMAAGFLLNNELTDFSAVAERDGLEVANRIEPGKRPRSSMAPTIVFDAAGKPVMAIGSPGGSRIINYVSKTIIGVLDFGMDIQAAISAPHFSNRNGDTDLEAGTVVADLGGELEAMGQKVRIRDMNSGLHGIVIEKNGHLQGGADPRREGQALGR